MNICEKNINMNLKNKNMIKEIKNFCTKISPNNRNENNKDYLCDSEFRSSIQIEESSTCKDIEAILKELDVEYDNEQESKQNNNKHHIKEGFKSSTLICFDAAAKIRYLDKKTRLVKKLDICRN